MLNEDYGKSLSTEDIQDDPTRYGWVNFDQFKRNRDRYMGRADDILASADKGSHILKNCIKRHIYEVEGYRCNSLEEVEKTASYMGIKLEDLQMRPDLIQAGEGKFDSIVRFISKETKEKRDRWR